MNATLQGRVQQTIDRLVESGDEIGLQVAAYLNGELVVDTWSGVVDEDTGQLVDGDTLFTSWSTTKGFVATCLHILADRGHVDYDTPVATYWPEFGVHGKDVVTVREALTHRAGVPQMPEGVTPEMMTDWDAMCAAIASLKPLWKPGAIVCYHAWTFGWIIGELVRRIDGRPIAQFAREDMVYPFVKTEKRGFLKCMVSFLVAIGGYAIPCLFFAWYRHLGVTLPSQGRAGASLIAARSASTSWPSARSTWP